MWLLLWRRRLGVLMFAAIFSTLGYLIFRADEEQALIQNKLGIPDRQHILNLAREKEHYDDGDFVTDDGSVPEGEDNVNGDNHDLVEENDSYDDNDDDNDDDKEYNDEYENEDEDENQDEDEENGDDEEDEEDEDEDDQKEYENDHDDGMQAEKEEEVPEDKQDEKNEERKASDTVDSWDKHTSHLLILAYMRTGSSMTGRILQYSPDVFYWYEPLHSLERYYVTGGDVTSNYRNRTLNEYFKASEMASGNISATLSCDIQHVYNLTLTDYFLRYGLSSTRFFHECFTTATNPAEFNKCAVNMTNICRRNFKATAVKTIRLTMSRAVDVMRRDPKVKVVHLIRDPRGVLLSRAKLGFADRKKWDSEAELLCRKYMDDLKAVPPVGDPLRDRYTLVRYEDIATQAIDHTYHLYKILDMEVSQSIVDSVEGLMQKAKKEKACPTCPRVATQNSTQVAQAWRQTLSLEEVTTISRQCEDVMRLLGYRVHFDDEAQLKDLRLSAVEPLSVK